MSRKRPNITAEYTTEGTRAHTAGCCVQRSGDICLQSTRERKKLSALGHRKNSSEQKAVLTKLRLQGDYHHNMNTLATGEDELITARRPGQDETKKNVQDFLLCEFCSGFFRKLGLWKHQASCQHKTPESSHQHSNRQVQQSAKLLIAPILTGSDNSVLNKILCSMNHGVIADIVRKDDLIKMLGAFRLEKEGERDRQLVSQKMRELGRLLQQLMVVENNEAVQLSDFIKPEKFDIIVKTVMETTDFMPPNLSQQEVNIPSLALKLGHSLLKCATLLHNQAIRARNDLVANEIKYFQKLMRSEWEDLASLLSTLKERKMNAVQVLPLAEDMRKLRKFVEQGITENSRQLKLSPTSKNWTALARLLLARVVMLNKRRSGEASKLLLNSYQGIPEWTKRATSEILSNLTPLEQRLSQR
ncbi:Hypothetical predicted protein [Paramuricea clavata]|uniref:Uncharacterized protein n=1 Tax=Paramuricea clavata TaxID=317549 RepID=A0A6S7JHV5_PARCT|nr:Hypothetical predicted protein [Paramuricea clavata]